MYAHTHTHTLSLNLIHLTPVQKGKLYCDSNTRCSFSVDVNAPLSYLHLCVNPLALPFSGLNFFQLFWTNTNLTQRKRKVVSAKWFIMNWCIKVIFSLDSSDLVQMLTVFFCNAFLVPKFCHCKELSAMPVMFNASTSNVLSKSLFMYVITCSLYQLLFKMQDFYKNVCFCTRTRSFVVLCIMVAISVDRICSRFRISPQTLTTGGYGASNSAVWGSSVSLFRDSVFCFTVSWGQNAHTVWGQCGEVNAK